MDLKIELLEEIGLTKAEIKVYLALLELGESTTGPLVDKSGASSSKIYEVLEKLLQKGLVSFVIKSGMKYFAASEPSRLLDYLKEKESLLLQQEQELQKMLPELELKKKLSEYKSEATIYKGMKGLETAFKDVFATLKKGDTNYVFVVGELDEPMNNFFRQQYELRAQAGIKTKTIFSESGRKYYESRKNIPLFEGKVIGTTTSPATVNIYGSKVNIRMGTSKNVICVVIDNKDLARTFLEQFTVLWNQDVNVYKGFDTVTHKFWSMLDYLKKGEEYLVLGATYGYGGQKLVEWFTRYHKERVAKGIKVRLLTLPDDFQSVLRELTLTGDPAMKLGQLKALSQEFSSPMQINLYPGNKVLMFLWGKEFMCFEIESEIVFRNFKAYFDALWNQKIISLQGESGVRTVFEDMLNYKEVWFIGGNDGIKKFFPQYWKEHNQERIKRKVVWHDLIDAKLMADLFPGQERGSVPYYEYRTLPAELSSPHVIAFYGDKVANIIWQKNTIITLIKNKEIREGYKKYFDFLWNQQTSTYQGYEGLKTIISETLQYPEVLFIGAGGYVPARMPDFWQDYNQKRIERKIWWKGLAREEILHSPLLKEKYFKYKLMPKAYQTPNVVWIFGNKVVNILWTEIPIAFSIENADVAKSYREYFNDLWKKEKRKKS